MHGAASRLKPAHHKTSLCYNILINCKSEHVQEADHLPEVLYPEGVNYL